MKGFSSAAAAAATHAAPAGVAPCISAAAVAFLAVAVTAAACSTEAPELAPGGLYTQCRSSKSSSSSLHKPFLFPLL